MSRPGFYSVDGSYSCPEGYKPCNKEFLGRPGGQDFVVCIPTGRKMEDVCPITSVAFELDFEAMDQSEQELYEKIETEAGHIYISRKVMQHGIEQV